MGSQAWPSADVNEPPTPATTKRPLPNATSYNCAGVACAGSFAQLQCSASCENAIPNIDTATNVFAPNATRRNSHSSFVKTLRHVLASGASASAITPGPPQGL